MFDFNNPLYQEDLKAVSRYIPTQEKTKSILVTGASGLIGSFIVDAFLWYNMNVRKDYIVYALSRSLPKLESRFSYVLNNGDNNEDDLILIAKDITKSLDETVCFNYIIHAASNADPGTYAVYPVETIQTNVLGITNVLEYARKKLETRVLFTSTMEVYGKMPDETINDEEMYGLVDFNITRAGYPESKRVSELLCRSYAEEYKVHAIITRLGYIYGPTMTKTDNKVVAQIIRSVINNEDIVLKSEGKQRRSYCYVADAAAGIICALFRGNDGEAYNVANRNSTVSIYELANIAANISGKTVVFDLPEQSSADKVSKPHDVILNEGKLCAIGWAPQYAIREGLERTTAILR